MREEHVWCPVEATYAKLAEGGVIDLEIDQLRPLIRMVAALANCEDPFQPIPGDTISAPGEEEEA